MRSGARALSASCAKTDSVEHYQDACAAPGNKTTHLTALLALADARSRKDQNGAEKVKKKKFKEDGGVQQGKVLAFERDKVREQVLRRQVRRP